jgi:hypothetical protein
MSKRINLGQLMENLDPKVNCRLLGILTMPGVVSELPQLKPSLEKMRDKTVPIV